MHVDESQETKRRITADFKATFDNPVGQRVFNYIMRDLLKSNSVIGPGPGERAVYASALHDVALQLNAILNRKFDDEKPVVRHTAEMRRRATQPAN